MERIKGLSRQFENVYFYHILRRLNEDADTQENQAYQREECMSQIHRIEKHYPIPLL